MKKYVRTVLVILCTVGFFTAGSCQSSNALKVVIIRHGEKPEKGNNLNCQGLNRSLELPRVINAKFGVPSIVFVPAVASGEKTKNSRMFQTISPLAIKYNLTVNSNHDEEDYSKIAKDVKGQTGTVIVAWEHKAIPYVVEALGVKKSDLDWPDNDYDSIWIITFKNGSAILTKDKEGLKPSAGCPF